MSMTSLKAERRLRHHDLVKRDKLLSVRLTTEDLKLLQQAAGVLWPGAPVSNSSILLGLAKLKAQEVLQKKGRPG